MRSPFHLFCAALVLATGLAAQAAAPKPTSKDHTPASVLSIMEKAADWQIANPSKWPIWGWHQAAYYTGVMALAEVSSSPRFTEAMVKVGEANLWYPGPRIYHADDHAVGQMYAELYFKTKNQAYIEKMRDRLDYILANPSPKKDLDFTGKEKNDRWSWCDALFMAPPTWLRMSVATGEKVYLDYMVEQWWITSDYLYDKEERMYFRDSTLFKQREANGKKIFWSRGNGWVLAGLARVIPLMPKDHPALPRFVAQYREMAERVAELQQPDGLWRASMLDPASYPMKETSGSGFFCFALAWGINHGLLDRAKYEPVVMKTWDALVSCVAPDGKVTHVQPVGFTPKSFDADMTEVYGVGAFLLAGTEVHRLLGGKPAASK